MQRTPQARSVDAALASPSRPLDGETRARMEPGLGHHFGDVRVHSGEAASAATDELGANAFSYGNDVVLGNDRAPNADHVLAHELTHVAQQGPQAGPPQSVSGRGAAHEREAERAAGAVGQGGIAHPSARAPAGQLMRDEKDKNAETAEGEKQKPDPAVQEAAKDAAKPKPAAGAPVKKRISHKEANASQEFDAIFDAQKAELTIRKRILFDFIDPQPHETNLYTAWGNRPGTRSMEQIQFIEEFKRQAATYWASNSTKIVLVPDGDAKGAPCPFVRVKVEVFEYKGADDPTPSEDAHDIVNVNKANPNRPKEAGPTEPVKGAVGGVTHKLSDTALGWREPAPGVSQVTAMHELGHMFGLGHSGKRAGQKDPYGDRGSDEEKDIMGKGMVVSTKDYSPFVHAMNELAPSCMWKAVEEPTESSFPAGGVVALLLGGGAVLGALGGIIGYFAAGGTAAAAGSIGFGAALGIGALIGLGVGILAAIGYGIYKAVTAKSDPDMKGAKNDRLVLPPEKRPPGWTRA